MSMGNINLQIGDDVVKLMDERGIREDDVKEVIYDCIQTKEMLYSDEENRYLAKKKLGEFTVYVDYNISEGEYVLNSVYSHRIQFVSEF